MIPAVRDWQVTFRAGERVLARFVVQAPTNLLARMAARDRVMQLGTVAFGAADAVTYHPLTKRMPRPHDRYRTPSDTNGRRNRARDPGAFALESGLRCARIGR